MTLGERLLEYRTNAKMSQDVLAEKIGVTRQTISKWETDQSTPEFNKIIPLCEIYGITTDELIKGEKTKTDYKEENNQKNEKRNKKKAMIISISIFLYCTGAFSLPYMTESLEYSVSHAIMITTTLWTIATVMLIYFFVANPKSKSQKTKEVEKETNQVIDTIEESNQKNARIEEKENVQQKKSNLEKRVIQIIALVCLLCYLIVSFATEEWHITWILWIVFGLIRVITKLVFDIRREKSEK